MITTADPASVPAHMPRARTDLSFVFDPNTRIGTVGGGLTDQVAHIALFDDLCRPQGLDLYLDDFRYPGGGVTTVSSFPPGTRSGSKGLQARIAALIASSVRGPTTGCHGSTASPSSWYDFGLREATVVTYGQLQLTSAAWKSVRSSRSGPPRRSGSWRAHLPSRQPRSASTPPSIGSRSARRAPSRFRRCSASITWRRTGWIRTWPGPPTCCGARRTSPFHVRRGDYLHPHFDTGCWHARRATTRRVDYTSTPAGRGLKRLGGLRD